MEQDLNRILLDIYKNPSDPGSFGGVERFFKSAKNKYPDITRNQILSFLKRHRPYTLHRPVRKRFSRNPTIVGGIDKQWQADLVDMQSISRHNKGNKYLLTVIDCFSKYAWVRPIKSKSGADIKAAFNSIFSAGDRRPEKLQTDKGKEFLNSEFQTFLKAQGVAHFVTQNETKAAMVERFNRTLKSRMWNYFTSAGTNHYMDILDKLVDSYNHSHHRTIGMRPVDVTREKEGALFHKMYGEHFAKSDFRKKPRGQQQQLDTVRISKHKTLFEKGYRPNWTEEVFKVKSKLKKPSKSVYKLEDLAGEEIAGTFYPEEIEQVYFDPNEPMPIEKIIRTRTNKQGIKEHLVKWFDYPSKFNSWVLAKDLQHI